MALAGPTSVLAAAVDPTSEHQFVFWRAANAHLYETWFDGSWHGPSDTGWNSASPPSVVVSVTGHQYVFWQGWNHHIYDASYNGRWSRARDLTRVDRWGRSGQSSSGVAAAVGWGNDHVFVLWRADNGQVYEAWYDGRWHGPRSTGWNSASRPSVGVGPGDHQYALWEGPNHDIYEAWRYRAWSRPGDLTRSYGWGRAGRTTSGVTVAVTPGTEKQFVFWHSPDGQVYQAWFDGSWHGPVNTGWRSRFAPSVAGSRAGHWYVFWQAYAHIWQRWYDGAWSDPVRRWSLSPGTEPYVEAVQTTSDLVQRLQPMSDPQFASQVVTGIPTVDVNDSVRYQHVTGVGAAMTDSSAWLLYSALSPDTRSALMNDLFSSGGIHLGFLVVPIGASDFSANGQPYTYDDLPPGEADPQLSQFSIAHDRSYILPALRRVLAVNPQMQVLAAPWSPPAWMKANDALGDSDLLGTIRPSAYQALASYFVKFIQAYEAEGVPVSAVAPQNEPDVGTTYPSTQFSEPDEAQWIAQDLKPALDAAGLNTRIYGADSGWSSAAYAQALASGQARGALAGIAWHCYNGAPTSMSSVQSAVATLDQVVTECAPNLTPYPIPEILIGAIRNGASAVTLWNLALDPSGGPVQQPNTGCGGCTGLVTINETDHSVTLNLDYYQLGQVGTFVEPGAVRVASNAFVSYQQSPTVPLATPGLDDVALLNPDGSRVLVAYDNSPASISFNVRWDGQSFTYSLPPWATVTFRWYPGS